jgi:gluconokinase
MNPIVMAIDVGSSSVRALLYDGRGDQIEQSEHQVAYTQVITADGGSESNPAGLFDLVVECVDSIAELAATHQLAIAAVGMTSFWHGLMGLGDDGSTITPVYMWSDKRSGPDAAALRTRIDAAAAHRRTGCRIHSSYWPAKLTWFRREYAARFQCVKAWVSVTDYILWRLFGTMATSISMASGSGLLNIETLDWDTAMLDDLEMSRSVLPGIIDRSVAHRGLANGFDNRWPNLDAIPWYPAIGDGAAANVGSGCVGDSRIAMTIGTSAAMRIVVPGALGQGLAPLLPERIWNYRLDQDYRVLGGALSNGGNVTGWIASHLAGDDFDTLTDAALAIRPDSHGLTVLPFLAGERSPSWNDEATGTFHGLRLSTTAGDIFRATLESTSYRMAAIYDDLRLLAAPAHEIHANGAAALKSPLWLQIIADTLGHRVDAVDAEAEASARGAALCALESIGALASLLEIEHDVSEHFMPNPVAHRAYARARKRQADLERAINAYTNDQRKEAPAA